MAYVATSLDTSEKLLPDSMLSQVGEPAIGDTVGTAFLLSPRPCLSQSDVDNCVPDVTTVDFDRVHRSRDSRFLEGDSTALINEV